MPRLNQQLQATLTQFAAQPGTTSDQEAQLRAAITRDTGLLQQLNQDAANGQLKGFALPQAGATANLVGTYDIASGLVTLPVTVFLPTSADSTATLRLKDLFVRLIHTNYAALRQILFSALVALSACSHSTTPPVSMPGKEAAAMKANSPDTAGSPHPHALEEFPELTPEEVGRRFLKLIDGLKSFDELSVERLQEVMRLRLTPSPETHGGFFTIHLPESGWYYGLSYYDNPKVPERRHAVYNFINQAQDEERENGLADMAPVCGMDFKAYVTELKKMGFVKREDLAQYDSPMPPMNADGTLEERRFFRLPGYFFSRGNIGVMIRERREANAPDDKLHHACVESISVGGGG